MKKLTTSALLTLFIAILVSGLIMTGCGTGPQGDRGSNGTTGAQGPAGNSAATGSLKVNVFCEDGTPMPQFEVALLQGGTVTGEARNESGPGYYIFSGIIPGDYQVTVTAPGFNSQTKPAIVEGDEEATVSFGGSEDPTWTRQIYAIGVTNTGSLAPGKSGRSATKAPITSNFYYIDPATGTPTLKGVVTGYDMYCLAVNPVDKKLYGIGQKLSEITPTQVDAEERNDSRDGMDPWHLITIDPMTGEPTSDITLTGDLGGDSWTYIYTLAIDASGNMYTVVENYPPGNPEKERSTEGIFVGTISATGVVTLFTTYPLDGAYDYINSLCFSPDGVLHLAAYNDSTNEGTDFFTVNTATGQQTPTGSIDGTEVECMDYNPLTSQLWCVNWWSYAPYISTLNLTDYTCQDLYQMTGMYIWGMAWPR